MITASLIAFSVIGLLAMWDSYLLDPARKSVERWGVRSGVASLIYFIDCHMCKAFWMCLIGCAIAGNLLLIIPTYGIVAVALAIMGEGDEE